MQRTLDVLGPRPNIGNWSCFSGKARLLIEEVIFFFYRSQLIGSKLSSIFVGGWRVGCTRDQTMRLESSK